MARKKTKGRQKLEMVKMTNATRLQVTFSKRCSGLFKKASELCTLCGAEVAIIAFSPSNKVHSFGHPCVKTLIRRFEYEQQYFHSDEMQIIEAYRQTTLSNLTSELSSIEQMLEEEICQGLKVRQLENWWENPIEESNMKQLELLMEQLEELKIDKGGYEAIGSACFLLSVLSLNSKKCMQYVSSFSSSMFGIMIKDLNYFSNLKMGLICSAMF